MESVPDWLALWAQLVEMVNVRRQQPTGRKGADVWQGRTAEYDAGVARRWARPDSSRRTLTDELVGQPGSTVLDIGAGTGSWAVMMAQHAGHVTAVDPSPAMLERLRQRVAEEGLSNVTVLEGSWPDVDVGPHDLVFCSHAMYGSPDLAGFVRRMEAVVRRRCYLLIRALMPGTVMAEAAAHVWGQPYDSPCFQVAYNGLLQMGIFADVQMEDSGAWEPWAHESLEAALDEVKRRLTIADRDDHDGFLRDLLAGQLTRVGDLYVWPPSVRSALISWQPGAANPIPT